MHRMFPFMSETDGPFAGLVITYDLNAERADLANIVNKSDKSLIF